MLWGNFPAILLGLRSHCSQYKSYPCYGSKFYFYFFYFYFLLLLLLLLLIFFLFLLLLLPFLLLLLLLFYFCDSWFIRPPSPLRKSRLGKLSGTHLLVLPDLHPLHHTLTILTGSPSQSLFLNLPLGITGMSAQAVCSGLLSLGKEKECRYHWNWQHVSKIQILIFQQESEKSKMPSSYMGVVLVALTFYYSTKQK